MTSSRTYIAIPPGAVFVNPKLSHFINLKMSHLPMILNMVDGSFV